MPVFRISACLLAAFLAGTSLSFAQSKDLTVQQQLVTEVTAPASGLEVTATVDREDNLYTLGDAIELSVTVNADAYLTIVGVGPTGNAVLLYPNEFQPGEMVAAGETVQIPGKGAPAQIIASAPAGNELVRVIASSSPIEVIARELLVGTGAFKEIDGGAEQVAKDLTVVAAAEPEVAFTDVVITTQESGDIEIKIDDAATEDDAAERQPPMIATDRDSYKIGDTVQLAVTAMEACHLWVINVSAEDPPHVLFPNKLMMDNELAAGQTVLVSGGASPVKVAVAGPAGTEAIYAICSEDATPPWQAGLDFSQMFPPLDGSEGLGKSLIAIDATDDVEDQSAIPDAYSWAVRTVTVTE